MSELQYPIRLGSVAYLRDVLKNPSPSYAPIISTSGMVEVSSGVWYGWTRKPDGPKTREFKRFLRGEAWVR